MLSLKNTFLSLFSQGGISLANLIVNISLVIALPVSEYGEFVLLFSVLMFLVGVIDALFISPLSTFLFQAQDDSKEVKALNTVFFVFLIFLLLLFFLFFSLFFELLFAFVATAYIFINMSREYFRGVNFSKLMPKNNLISDCVYIVMILLSCSLILYLNIQSIFIALTLFVLSSLFAVFLLFNTFVGFESLYYSFDFYKSIWGKCKWNLFGLVSYEGKSRGYIYIVTSFKGLGDLGRMNVSRVFFSPVVVLSDAIRKILRPYLSSLANQGLNEKVFRTMFFFYLVLLVLGGGYLALIIIFLDVFLQFSNSSKFYGIEDFVIYWGGVSIISLTNTIIVCGFESFRMFKAMAKITMIFSILSVLIVSFVALNYTTLDVVKVLVVLELIASMVMLFVFVNKVKDSNVPIK